MNRAVLLLLPLLLPALSNSQTFPVLQDAYVVPGNATNFGSAPSVTVGSSQSQGLLQFDLSSLPAGISATQVTKATLILFANTVSSPGSISVYTANGPWTESGVSGTNMPAVGTSVAASVAIPASAKGSYVSIDVTSAVQAWVSGTTVNSGLVIQTAAGTIVQFDSKENTTTSHPPALAISLSLGPIAYSVTGPAVNLSNDGLQLQMNGGPVLSVPGGSTNFSFPAKLYNGQTFQAALLQQPANEICSLNTQTGAMVAGNANLSVSCIGPPTITPANLTATGASPCIGTVYYCSQNVKTGSIALTWTIDTPSANSPVTAYTVTASPSGATLTTSNTSVTFGNLALLDSGQNPIKWSFTVAATNALGAGPSSAPSNTISVPSHLSNVHLVSSSYRCNPPPQFVQETIAWDPPTDSGGAGPVLMEGEIHGVSAFFESGNTGWGTATSVSFGTQDDCSAIFFGAAQNQFGMGPLH